MELIATHLGADFDAYASMVAAAKLYPGARLFFPGSRQESLRRMIDRTGTEIPEVRQKEVDPSTLERIVLCDIRQRDRIGVVAEWLETHPEIELVVYDHHPDTDSDLETEHSLVDPTVGATCTLMAEHLAERGVELTPSEATLLLMGIYEDTGSLAYPTTSPRDLQAAARLLEQGADLSVVRRFAVHSLDAVHLEILYRMTEELEVRRIHDHRVGVVAMDLGGYTDELAPLVSRCLDLQGLPLLFALFGEGDRVTVIARGELEGFHLGKALESCIGGGGHATAAAGAVKGRTVLEAREELLHCLEEILPPAARASDLMVSSFVTVPCEATVGEAKEQLVRARINAAPVVEPATGRPVGGVTRQILDAALQHGLEGRSVTRVMGEQLEWVRPEAPADEVGRRMLGRHPRFILVGNPEESAPVGLITRMAVLRHLHGQLEEAARPLERRTREQRERRHQIGKLVRQRLSPELYGRLEQVAEVSRREEMPVFLVGGIVRDLLLDRENRDVDLVVEGDGPRFATRLAEDLGGRVKVHAAFMTAVVLAPDGFPIDVATARSEFYRAPAALPEVQSSPLRQDLYRRDFTINTLALRLGPDRPFELIDYFGGERDLKERTLRVLHSLSFIDDPTRVLRAARLEQRLGFAISSETLRLVRVALAEGVFERLSGARLRDELALLLAEPASSLRGLERLDELGVLAVLHPRLALDEAKRRRLRRSRSAYDWYRLEGLERPAVDPARLLLLALAADLSRGERAELADRLKLSGEGRRQLFGCAERVAEAKRILEEEGVAPHRVSEALEGLSGDEVLLLMAVGGSYVQEWVRRDLGELRPLRLQILGRDLLAAGFSPGPPIGEALQATRAARLDGAIGPEEELEFALAHLRKSEAARAGRAGPEEGAER